MDTIESMFYQSMIKDENVTSKAIANFLFREVIEDAHTKYGISQEDMRKMCREAVNRAAVLEEVLNDSELRKALLLYGYSTKEWDDPDPGEVSEKLRCLKEMAENI